MTRLLLPFGRRALFGAMLAIALLALLPMRLLLGWAALDEQGFSARAVSGSIWSGHLAEARFGDIPLGDLDARVAPLPLLIGRARVVLARADSDPAAALSGAIEITRHSAAVLHASGALTPGAAFAPLPVARLTLDDASVRFDDGVCVAAEGRVGADLIGDFAGAPLPGTLSGTARCDGGALLLTLTAGGSAEGVLLRLWGDGRYRAELTLVPIDPAAAARLDASGFVAEGAARRLTVTGRF